MGASVIVNVQNCEQCPYHKTEKVYIPDSFKQVRKVYCSDLKKDTHKYLDWNDTSIIPCECRFIDEHDGMLNWAARVIGDALDKNITLSYLTLEEYRRFQEYIKKK